jgi:hypothetical protein
LEHPDLLGLIGSIAVQYFPSQALIRRIDDRLARPLDEVTGMNESRSIVTTTAAVAVPPD